MDQSTNEWTNAWNNGPNGVSARGRIIRVCVYTSLLQGWGVGEAQARHVVGAARLRREGRVV